MAIKLVLIETDRPSPQLVNPDHVVRIHPHAANEAVSIVYLSDGQKFVARGEPHEIATKLIQP